MLDRLEQAWDAARAAVSAEGSAGTALDALATLLHAKLRDALPEQARYGEDDHLRARSLAEELRDPDYVAELKPGQRATQVVNAAWRARVDADGDGAVRSRVARNAFALLDLLAQRPSERQGLAP
jgi:hypothetical protein